MRAPTARGPGFALKHDTARCNVPAAADTAGVACERDAEPQGCRRYADSPLNMYPRWVADDGFRLLQAVEYTYWEGYASAPGSCDEAIPHAPRNVPAAGKEEENLWQRARM